jgi:hypothetical protein
MEEIKVTPETHPYLNMLLSSLSEQKRVVELLEKRIALLPLTGTENELNEAELTKILTKHEINSRKENIKRKEDYYNQYFAEFKKDMVECNANFKMIMGKAEREKKTNAKLEKFLNSVNFAMIEDSIEMKVDFYKRIKGMLKF